MTRPVARNLAKIRVKPLFAPQHGPEMEIMKQMLKSTSSVDFAMFTAFLLILVRVLAGLRFRVVPLLFDNRRLYIGGFAIQLGIKNHHLILLGSQLVQSGIALFLVALAFRFMLETHEAFGRRAKFHGCFCAFDSNVDFRHTMHMRVMMALFGRSEIERKDQQ